MLFKFKSKACADLIMLEADGRRLLQILIGDDPVQGIIQVADLAAALERLDAAVAKDEAQRQVQAARAAARAAGQAVVDVDEEETALPSVRLAQRASPMQQMIRRCIGQKADLVWGV